MPEKNTSVDPQVIEWLAKADHVWEIPLDQIRPAPWNPPSRMDPSKVKELAASIKIEGQQSPALMRPVEAEAPVRYELVWGHRRYAALQLLAANGGGPETTLKAFIREMSEEQAMISSGIENLQREGFSDIEEAEFFRTCSAHYGESAVKILAEKLSVSDRYIRKRIEILKLPDAALELWRSGTWHVGHMEQLLRIGEPERVTEFMASLANNRHKKPDETAVWQLKDMVDHLAVPLHSGRFDKADCKVCRKNTDCQRRLFGGEKENKTKCLDQACFQQKQQAWLDINWSTCKANKFGTQAAVIGDWNTKNTGSFSGYSGSSRPGPAEKCSSCPHYTTALNLKGESIYDSLDRVCLGPKSCFDEIQAAGKKTERAAKVKPGETAADFPRVAWHGEFYRQEFYQQEIPLLMDRLAADDPRHLQLTVATVLYAARGLHVWFLQEIGREDLQVGADSWFRLSFYQLLTLVRTLEVHRVKALLANALVKIALCTDRGYETIFIDADRQALAEFLDIDFARFQVTPEYLQKKTKAEVLRFIVHDSGLWQTPEFKDAMIRHGFSTASTPEKLAGAKKPLLVDLVLNCGVDLHGRLPKEIADRPKLATDPQD